MTQAHHRAGSGNSAVVLCHGFGANGNDLAALADVFDPERRRHWLFPDAPNPMDSIGLPGGRAWYPRSREELTAAVYGGYFGDLSKKDPPGLGKSGDLVRNLVGELIDSEGLSWERVILGGFSQGTTVAIETALGASGPPAGLVLFSGTIIAEARWRGGLSALSGTPFFQSHGTSDSILAIDEGRALHRLLCDAGLKGELMVFDGGHAIPEAAVMSAQSFLESVWE